MHFKLLIMVQNFFTSVFSKFMTTFKNSRWLEQLARLESLNHSKQKSEENVGIDCFASDPFIENLGF